jgi:hypothetical protein
MRKKQNFRTRTRTEATSKTLALANTQVGSDWFDEPVLEFGSGNTHPDPKIGIPLYGPRSLGTPRHKSEVHVGFIGTAQAIENVQRFYEQAANGVSGYEPGENGAGEFTHAPFPGCRNDRGFRCDLRFNPATVEPITRQESQEVTRARGELQRLELLLGYAKLKLELLTQKDQPLDYIVFALSEELYSACRVADYRQNGTPIHRDLRRAFKAMAMEFLKPTQILREGTTGNIASASRDLDHQSRIAWNLFTGLYFKVDGLPWGPTGLAPATCFIGVSFFRPFGSASTLRTSVVQAFDENGEGLVLRGHDFHWDDERQGRSPHLDGDSANRLIQMVLSRYVEERKQAPQRVVIHKTSRFGPAEREGFESALKASRVKQYDLVALTPVSDVRLARAGTYPPLRGTNFSLGNDSYLYTTGYSHILQAYPHGHVPSPLLVTDHVGDTPKSQLLKEILVLTKMNWNSANFGGLLPITLRFSRLVGEILREVPPDRIPNPKYKFYM